MPHPGGLEIRVLGPVVITAPDDAAVPAPRLERALAVRLALARGMPVPDGSLARDLWGDVELTHSVERLRVLVARLRAALGGAAETLGRTDGGYTLQAMPVDLIAAEAAVSTMRGALRGRDHRSVATAAAQALALWRGPALADLRGVPFALTEGVRLDGLRLDVQIERLLADIESGRAADTIAELEELAGAHPLHERVHCLLAVALHRMGRQTDALDELARLRRALADELGADPAPETVQLEQRLRRQDAELSVYEPAATIPEARLQAATSTFVGRERELAALLEQLRAPGLVTLTGTSGSGKTRLALEVARATQWRGRPVAWVDLAPLSESDTVTPAIAVAAGVDASPDGLVTRLAGALNHALLVIDNAEHLVEPVAALMRSVLPAAAGLTVVVTSQRPIMISGEEIHHVGPLIPAAAAALFCERGGVQRDRQTHDQVDAICAAVDCLPLGVELAAGLTLAVSVDQIAQGIDDRLRLLVDGSRDAGGRHTSLKATLDWSYRLLEPTAATVLRRLAVFAGGCTPEGAEYVIAGDGVSESDVETALAELTERCLVTVSAVSASNGGRRFGLLDPVRDYAANRLAVSPDEPGVSDRYLAWCAWHVAEHDVLGSDEATALAAVFAEWANLLSALEHAPGTPRAGDGLRLALALDDAWTFAGLHDLARRHYAALVDAPGVTDRERARALSNYGFASTLVGETTPAAALLDRASLLAEAADDAPLRMRALYHRGIALVEGGLPREAFEPLRQGERIAIERGRDRSVSAFRDVIATAYLYCGEATKAANLHRAANAMDREVGNAHGLVRGLVNETNALLAAGAITAALRSAEEARGVAEPMRDLVASANVRLAEGRVAMMTGDVRPAIDSFRAALAGMRPEGVQIGAQLSRLDLADALLHAGETAEARTIVDEVLAGTRDRGLTWLLAQPTLAALAGATGDLLDAARIVRETEAVYARRGFQWALAVSRLEHARGLLLPGM